MKRKIILILLLNISAIFSSEAKYNELNVSNSYLELQQLKYGKNLIPVGEITSSIIDSIKLKPDTVEFSITLETEGTTPTEASDLNVNTMKKLKSYLSTLNITDDNLVTIDYKNSVKTIEKEDDQENTNYQATLNVVLTIDNNDSFINLNKTLDKYNINNISPFENDKLTNYYLFQIVSVGNSESKTKEDLYQKYTSITNELKKIGLTNFSIKSSSVSPIDKDTINEQRYFVNNTLKIKINKLDLIGKIIAKAQELKMQVNNDISYSVSPEAIQTAVKKHETLLLNQLTSKVERLVTQKYVVGAPISLEIQSRYPETIYQRNNFSSNSTMFKMVSMNYSDVDIYTPPEYEITLTLSGSFETLKLIRFHLVNNLLTK